MPTVLQYYQPNVYRRLYPSKPQPGEELVNLSKKFRSDFLEPLSWHLFLFIEEIPQTHQKSWFEFKMVTLWEEWLNTSRKTK